MDSLRLVFYQGDDQKGYISVCSEQGIKQVTTMEICFTGEESGKEANIYLDIRVENKLQSIETQFTVLESSMKKLSEKLAFRSTALENEIDQNEMWESLLENSFTSVEVNLFYSYIWETINCLHSQVIESLSDLAGSLPTLSSILRWKGKSQRIRLAWESALETLELQERDIKALCAFFMIHSYDACYYPANQRQTYTSDISSLIHRVVKSQHFKRSLLCAVHVIENKKV